MLKRIFGPKRDKVAGSLRKVHNKDNIKYRVIKK
jgi:hypothetical protein